MIFAALHVQQCIGIDIPLCLPCGHLNQPAGQGQVQQHLDLYNLNLNLPLSSTLAFDVTTQIAFVSAFASSSSSLCPSTSTLKGGGGIKE